MGIALIIGGVDLFEFEVPQELPGVGGTQMIAEKKFPGGDITQQELGAFPHQITWSGYLTGPTAFARQQALDALRVAGNDVMMEYGIYAWMGKVSSFNAKVKHQFLVLYEITFDPSKDLTAASQISSSLSVDSIFNFQMSSFANVVAGVTGLALPSSLTGLANSLTSTVDSNLALGDGTVGGLSNASLTAILASVSALKTGATPLIAGNDATQASPALDASAYAGTVGTSASVSLAPRAQFLALNPNLFLIAQQYLGDSSDWDQVASASGLSDPQPIGTFIITIPSDVR